jgi:hypothetical protein
VPGPEGVAAVHDDQCSDCGNRFLLSATPASDLHDRPANGRCDPYRVGLVLGNG